VYAAALLALASEAGTTEIVREELEGLARLSEQEPQFTAFLSSAALDADDRELSLERMFRGRLSDLLLNTLQVMNRHGRLALLPQLLRAYTLRLEDARGQVEVTARTAVELDPEQKEQVVELAQRLSGRKPLVEFVVDPELIGGLVLEMADHRYDNSIRRHLAMARRRLLERPARAST